MHGQNYGESRASTCDRERVKWEKYDNAFAEVIAAPRHVNTSKKFPNDICVGKKVKCYSIGPRRFVSSVECKTHMCVFEQRWKSSACSWFVCVFENARELYFCRGLISRGVQVLIVRIIIINFHYSRAAMKFYGWRPPGFPIRGVSPREFCGRVWPWHPISTAIREPLFEHKIHVFFLTSA